MPSWVECLNGKPWRLFSYSPGGVIDNNRQSNRLRQDVTGIPRSQIESLSISISNILFYPLDNSTPSDQSIRQESIMKRISAIWLAPHFLIMTINADKGMIQGRRQLRRHPHSVHIPTYSIDERFVRFTVNTFEWFTLQNQQPGVAAMIHHPNSRQAFGPMPPVVASTCHPNFQQVVWPMLWCLTMTTESHSCCSFLLLHP